MNETLHIWLHDYYSTYGTAVGQNGMSQEEVRRKETWLLAFPPGAANNIFKETTIHCSSLVLKIEFPNQRAETPRYVENLRAFVKECRGIAARSKVDLPIFEGLGFKSEPSTQAPSEARNRL